MARPVSRVADEVVSRSKGLDRLAIRATAAHTAGNLTLSDLERVHAGAYVAYVRFVERSIERAFLGLLMGRFVSSRAGVRPLVSMESEKVARAVVNGGRSYVDWLPFERHTTPRAKAFFSRDLPFSALPALDRGVLRRASAIRNAIAHESRAALKSFEAQCVNGVGLPPRQRKPGGYLLGQHTVGQTRFQFLMAETNAVARKLYR